MSRSPTVYDPRITSRLYELRRAAHVSQQVAAAYFGLSDRNSVGAWENGQHRPHAGQRNRFLTYLTELLQLDTPRLEELWAEVMVGQWGWPPLTCAELPCRVGPVPLQRPPQVEHYTSRDDGELSHLLHELRPGRVVTLCGPGGVGKTSLASVIAWTLAPGDEAPPRFPDGLLFYSFYNQSQVAVALEQIARSYGEEPRPTAQAAAQRVLARRRALLILDGAERADDLPSLLAMRGECGVLITTRRRADAQAARYDVTPLPIDQAILLLQKWAGPHAADREVARQICTLVGGLPLAVRLAGQRMVHHELHGEEFLAWLQQTPLQALDLDQRSAEGVLLLMEQSRLQLNLEASAAFAAIGALALSPFDKAVVAAALDVPTATITWILGELVNQSWLYRLEERYQVVHPLIHTFAQERLEPAPPLLTRMASYYCGIVTDCTALGNSGFQLLDQERPHLLALLRRCVALGQWSSAYQLATTMDPYLNLQGHWRERLATNQWGLEAARQLNLLADELIALRNLANSYQQLGEYDRAVALYQEALALSNTHAEHPLADELLHNLGETFLHMNRYDDAETHLVASRQLRQELGDWQGEAYTLLALGMVYRQWGRWEEASQLYMTSWQTLRELGDRRGEYMALKCLGIVQIQRGQWHQAFDACAVHLALTREQGDRQAEADTLAHLGFICVQLKQTNAALAYAMAGVELAQAIGSHPEEALALNNLGAVYAILERWSDAEKAHQASLQCKLVLGEKLGIGHSFLHLGRVYRCQRHLKKATAHLKISLSILRSLGNSQGEGMALGELGVVYHLQQRHLHARTAWRAALTKLHPASPEFHAVNQSLADALIDTML